MTILEMMEARLADLRAAETAAYESRGQIIDLCASEKRGLSDEEQTRYDDLSAKRSAAEAEMAPVEERVTELRAAAVREQAAAATRAAAGDTTDTVVRVTSEPAIYRRGNITKSYFRDLAHAQIFGDSAAADDLRRHTRQVLDSPEYRALGNTNASLGSGGEFAPPAYLIADWIALARAGRVTADLLNHMDVPPGKSSVNLPKILTGTTVALQTTQNTALSQTDLTTAYVTTGFSTVGGKQVVSQQLLDQSEIDFDAVITGDLAAAWGTQVGTQIVSGTGTGTGTNSLVNGLASATIPAGNTLTFTSGAPTAALFYSKAAGALSAFATNRFADPTVWVMHPRRWFWLLAQVDSQGRPLVVPTAVAFNPLAQAGDFAHGAGIVGNFLGLPVAIDPLIPTNVGAGTNQDNVYLLKADDLWLMESTPQVEVFREPYADSMGVLFRLYSYLGAIWNRQTFSLAVITGTGLVAPTF
ncbi:MAG: hypothetical protein NVSMB4_00600 [Acidimicrobiales bacterium]